MTQTPPRYSVLLAKPEYLKQTELTNALAAFKNIRLHEAARLARSAWGFAGEDMEESEAQELSARLKEAGLGAVVLPINLVEELPKILPVTQAELTDEGFQPILKSGESELIPWKKLALIAAAGFEQITVTTTKTVEGPTVAQKAANIGFMMATGLPIKIAGKKQEVKRVERRAETLFYLDLYLRHPLKRWRLNAKDFNYSCLKERKAYNVLMNLRTLTAVLVQKAPQALKNRGTSVLTDGGAPSAMGYSALADLDKESRWLLTLETLRNP